MRNHSFASSLALLVGLSILAVTVRSEPIPDPALNGDDGGVVELVAPPADAEYVSEPAAVEEMPANADSGGAYCEPGSGYPETFRERWRIHCWEHWGYPGEFLPVPLGMSYNACFQAQVVNGIAAQMFLYRYDFQQPELDSNPSHLCPRGHQRLCKLAARLGTTPVPLVIEATGDCALDAARRKYVLAELAKYLPAPIPSEYVVIGTPKVRGLNGLEALIIDANLMEQTRQRGMSAQPSRPGLILSPVAPAQPSVNSPRDGEDE